MDKNGGRLGFEGQIKVIFSKDTKDKFVNSKSYRNHKWYVHVRPTIEKTGFSLHVGGFFVFCQFEGETRQM